MSPRQGSTQDQRPQTSQLRVKGNSGPNTVRLTTVFQPPRSMTEPGTQRQQGLMTSGTPQSSEVRGGMEEVREGMEEVREGMEEVIEGWMKTEKGWKMSE